MEDKKNCKSSCEIKSKECCKCKSKCDTKCKEDCSCSKCSIKK